MGGCSIHVMQGDGKRRLSIEEAGVDCMGQCVFRQWFDGMNG